MLEEKNFMSKLIVLSGIPGSGKSYFSKSLKNKKGTHVYIISSDAIREQIFDNPQDLDHEDLIWHIFYKLPEVYSYDKEAYVVLDATHMFVSRRIDNTIDLKPLFDEIDLIYFDIDKDIIIKQNKNRDWPVPDYAMESFFANFQKPTIEDEKFFDHVYVIKNNDIEDVINKI